MTTRFEMTWDAERPLLLEYLGPGRWSEQDEADYLQMLAATLADAPAGGFDMISDVRDYTMQNVTDADAPAYRMIAEAGGRRLIMIVTQSIVALQAVRIIRELGIADRLAATHVTTMEDALAQVPDQ